MIALRVPASGKRTVFGSIDIGPMLKRQLHVTTTRCLTQCGQRRLVFCATRSAGFAQNATCKLELSLRRALQMHRSQLPRVADLSEAPVEDTPDSYRLTPSTHRVLQRRFETHANAEVVVE